jgi:DNA repair and recombination protein RAD52
VFTDAQKSQLTAPLNRSNVKSRKQGGRGVSYIEGWKAIEEANRIFGFDSWTRETTELRLVSSASARSARRRSPAGACRMSPRSASWSLPLIPW